MSVLSHFFQISMVFALLLFGINAIIANFGYDLTGQNPAEEFLGLDSNVSTTIAQTSTVTQSSDTDVSAGTIETAKQNPLALLLNYVIGFQIIIYRMAANYGLTGFATAIIFLMTIIQMVGLSYLFIAIAAILWPGSGSAP